MEYLGRHLIAELYNCDVEKINNPEFVDFTLRKAAEVGNMHIINSFCHKFGEVGVSVVVIIAESHISFHSWPEHQYCAIDIFACGEQVKLEDSLSYLMRQFGCSTYSATEIRRGANIGKSQ